MATGFSIGYLNFTVFIMLVSGALILLIDVKQYENAGMSKERKASRFFGWFNMVLAAVLFTANYIMQMVT